MAKKTATLGGTFDILHRGHKALFKRAFSLGRVVIGLTSDNYVRKHKKKRKINSFAVRKRNLVNFIKNNFSGQFEIEKLEDRFGDAVKRDFDYIVVSPESLKGAEEINKRRKKLGKKPIKIIKIPFVLGKDKKPLSSTGIALTYTDIIKKLRALANKKNREGMARFGINPKNTLGISVYVLRDMAKQIGKDHEFALKLWDSRIHEARILAGFIADPEQLTEKQMEKWVRGIDSWDICDQVCSSLFVKTPFAKRKILEWIKRKEEFVKRSGFVLIVAFSVYDKELKNSFFERFFSVIKKESVDERNFVKKAVNWTLRQIGKRNLTLNKKAIRFAEDMMKMKSRSARWIASNALSELRQKRKLMTK